MMLHWLHKTFEYKPFLFNIFHYLEHNPRFLDKYFENSVFILDTERNPRFLDKYFENSVFILGTGN